MMITYTTGNIFESYAECLVNTVNCEGYMGKGIAYQFKLRYPQNNKDYIRVCKNKELYIGSIHSFYEDGKIIVNFPTKDKWREKSKMSYIETGLDLLVEFIKNKSITSIAIPPLGCGNGGLDWDNVKHLIDSKLNVVDDICDVIVYEPFVSYKVTIKEPPKLSLSSLVLLKLRMQLEQFGALRLQKTAFFVNYYLKDEYFKFDKGNYGPYSHSVDIVARNIKEYQQFYNLNNSKDTYNQVYNVICSKNIESGMNRLTPAINSASLYVNKIDTDKKLEGVTTVLYIIEKNKNVDYEEIIKIFKQWSDDKAKRFSSEYISGCIEYLENTNIISKNICGLYEVNDYDQ